EEPAVCRSLVRGQFGLAPAERLIVGVDRLDYTKGLEEKILAVERLLDQAPAYRGALAFVQIAQPSRQHLPAYKQLRQRVLAQAARVNARFSTGSWNPVHLIERHVAPAEVYRMLRAADVCYVGSLYDGMNLVAKEFVASRSDEDGVLVLSAFAGAARELQDAVLINPYDTEQTANGLDEALTMDLAVRGARMRRMRVCVSSWTSGCTREDPDLHDLAAEAACGRTARQEDVDFAPLDTAPRVEDGVTAVAHAFHTAHVDRAAERDDPRIGRYRAGL